MNSIKNIVISISLIGIFGLAIPAFIFAQTTGLITDGDLVKTADSFDVYIVKVIEAKKFKRLILNPEIFNSYDHLKWENVKTVSQALLEDYTTSDLVIEVDSAGSIADPKVYRVTSASGSDVGERRWLNITAEEFEAAGYDWDSIYYINSTEASPDFYPTKTPLTSKDIFSDIVDIPITDTISPFVSNIQSTKILADSAEITWDTDEDSDTLVMYGFSESALSLSATGTVSSVATTTFGHVVKLSGLESEKAYYYQVSSTDSSSNKSQLVTKSFTTTNCHGDVPGVHATIQEAIDATKSGGRVCISSGTYEENVKIDGKDITLAGAGEKNTIIKAKRASEGADTDNPEPQSALIIKNVSSATTIERLKITNGNYYGIWLDNASPVIQNNIIADNYAGIRILGASRPTIKYNVFENNTHGSAITHHGTVGGYDIDHNTFLSNGISGGSAAILFDSNFPNTPVVVSNNIFSGGVMALYEANTTFNFYLNYNLFYNQTETLIKRIAVSYFGASAINDLSNTTKNIVGDPLLDENYEPGIYSPTLTAAEDGGKIGAY